MAISLGTRSENFKRGRPIMISSSLEVVAIMLVDIGL